MTSEVPLMRFPKDFDRTGPSARTIWCLARHLDRATGQQDPHPSVAIQSGTLWRRCRFQRQLRVVRFDGRYINQRAHALLSGGDLASTNEPGQGAFTDREKRGSVAGRECKRFKGGHEGTMVLGAHRCLRVKRPDPAVVLLSRVRQSQAVPLAVPRVI
jgi:hypothetical protein